MQIHILINKERNDNWKEKISKSIAKDLPSSVDKTIELERERIFLMKIIEKETIENEKERIFSLKVVEAFFKEFNVKVEDNYDFQINNIHINIKQE